MHSIEDLGLFVRRAGDLTVQVQLAEQLRYHIDEGTWRPGDRLPPVRSLARALAVNYSTIRAVLGQLVREGYVRTEQGRGTFVCPLPPKGPRAIRAELHERLESCLAWSQAHGVDAAAFARTAYLQAHLRPTGLMPLRWVYVDETANRQQHFAARLHDATGVAPITAGVDDVPKLRPLPDLVASPLHLAQTIEARLPAKLPVLGLVLEPAYREVILELVHLPAQSTVGLVASNAAATGRMRRALLGAGLDNLTYVTAHSRSGWVALGVHCHRILIAPFGPRNASEWPEPSKVVVYTEHFSDSGLRLLRQHMVALHRREHRIRTRQSRG